METLSKVAFLGILMFLWIFSFSDAHAQLGHEWSTNTNKKNIDLNELMRGGPPKDGIPSIDNPKFITSGEASSWLRDKEPVVLVEIDGEARAYPIQILMWHEMVNDWFGDKPVLVTFCPLCYSAITFDRRHRGDVLEFGVSGFLRHSDMIMYDRQTESLWQQFSGEAHVGDYTGDQLKIIPSQLISFEQFREIHPNGKVLSRDTGHRRDYGKNPYVGYDDINSNPWALRDQPSDRMKPMEKVIGVRIDDEVITYPYSITQERKVINDQVGGKNIVVFHTEGAVSALDKSNIHSSREDGSTGVFFSTIEGQTLEFEYKNGEIRDKQTNSVWNITGKATDGPMKGKSLEPTIFGDYFAFAWLVFYPDAPIFGQAI
ncbi:MAG: DUF3179 domain-containing protein [Balneolaceae bacterium]